MIKSLTNWEAGTATRNKRWRVAGMAAAGPPCCNPFHWDFWDAISTKMGFLLRIGVGKATYLPALGTWVPSMTAPK